MPKYPHDKRIGERLKKARLRVFGDRGMRTYVRVTGVAMGTLHSYESGKFRVPVDFLVRFSNFTGAPLLWLILGQPEDFNVDELEVFEGEVRLTHEQMIRRAWGESPTPAEGEGEQDADGA